jgi:hypothetical protein
VRRGHPDVGDDDIGTVLAHLAEQLVGIAASPTTTKPVRSST